MKNRKHTYKYIIGVDEVGRGPIAGPVTVGAVLLPADYSRQNFKGLKDSKKLTAKNREEWFSYVRASKDISYTTTSVSEKIIDSKGIVHAITTALRYSLKKLNISPEQSLVLLDGGLYAPEEFTYQKTIVKGDEREHAIALASIMAKVTRDRKMVRLGNKYPEYGFETHKGYGTEKHYEQIKKCGICDLHRRSFLKGLKSSI